MVMSRKYPNLFVIRNHYAHLRSACKIHYLYAFRCLFNACECEHL